MLNTGGTDRTGVDPELIELPEYFRSSTPETAVSAKSGFVKELDKMLAPIKNSFKFGGDYMSYQEKIYTERKAAWQEGIREGRQEGRQEGIREGRREGRQEGAE